MTPWPHMVLYPSLCRNRTPRSAPGVTGGVGTQPYMSKWPRGSHIRARRRWSRFSRIQRRRSRIEAPGRGGRPPVMMRRGSPAACVSMAVMTVLPSLGGRVVQSRFIGGRRLPEVRGCAVGDRWMLDWLPASNRAGCLCPAHPAGPGSAQLNSVPAVVGRARKLLRSGFLPLPNDLDVPLGPVHADKGPIRNRLGRSIDPDHRRYAVLAGDDGAVSHEPPDFGHEARRERKERRPGRIGVRGYQDFALFEL